MEKSNLSYMSCPWDVNAEKFFFESIGHECHAFLKKKEEMIATP
jgi:hypothetical protein